MGFSTRYLISLLCVLLIDDIRLPTVKCQDQEGSRCLPRKTFLALLRHPEVGSSLAAYSRTARIIQDAKDRSDYVNLKSMTTSDEGEDAKIICLPAGVYLELFSDSAMRGHLSAIGRAQKMFEDPVERAYEIGDLASEDILESEKRSIATLAKNGDLPISIQDRSQDEAEGAATETARFDALSSESLDGLMKILSDSGVEDRRNIPEIAAEYTLENGELDLEALARDYPPAGKRNVAALARDFALPPSSGKRNIAVLARDYGLPSGKRNVGTLARDRMLPNGKRNVESMRRVYLFPAGKKSSLATVTGTMYRLRNSRPGKRYLGALARSADLSFPPRDNYYGKRNVGTLARDWSLPNQSSNRHGRSLDERRPDVAVGKTSTERPVEKTSAFEAQLANANNDLLKKLMDGKRAKRQIDYSDEYPLPVMQGTNVFDYEDMMMALAGGGGGGGGEYPDTEKRFMGRIPQMGPRPTTPPTRRLGR